MMKVVPRTHVIHIHKSHGQCRNLYVKGRLVDIQMKVHCHNDRRDIHSTRVKKEVFLLVVVHPVSLMKSPHFYLLCCDDV